MCILTIAKQYFTDNQHDRTLILHFINEKANISTLKNSTKELTKIIIYFNK